MDSFCLTKKNHNSKSTDCKGLFLVWEKILTNLRTQNSNIWDNICGCCGFRDFAFSWSGFLSFEFRRMSRSKRTSQWRDASPCDFFSRKKINLFFSHIFVNYKTAHSSLSHHLFHCNICTVYRSKGHRCYKRNSFFKLRRLFILQNQQIKD